MHKIWLLIGLVLTFSSSPYKAIDYDLVISNVNLIDGTGNPIQREIFVGIKGAKSFLWEKI